MFTSRYPSRAPMIYYYSDITRLRRCKHSAMKVKGRRLHKYRYYATALPMADYIAITLLLLITKTQSVPSLITSTPLAERARWPKIKAVLIRSTQRKQTWPHKKLHIDHVARLRSFWAVDGYNLYFICSVVDDITSCWCTQSKANEWGGGTL